MSSEYLYKIRRAKQMASSSVEAVDESKQPSRLRKSFYPIDLQCGNYITKSNQVIPLPQPKLPEGLNFGSFEVNVYRLIGIIDYATGSLPYLGITLEIAESFFSKSEATTCNKLHQITWFINDIYFNEAFDFTLNKDNNVTSVQKRTIDILHYLVEEGESKLDFANKPYCHVSMVNDTDCLFNPVRGPLSQDKLLVFQFLDSLFFEEETNNTLVIMKCIENTVLKEFASNQTIMWDQKDGLKKTAYVYNL